MFFKVCTLFFCNLNDFVLTSKARSLFVEKKFEKNFICVVLKILCLPICYSVSEIFRESVKKLHINSSINFSRLHLLFIQGALLPDRQTLRGGSRHENKHY